MNQILKQEGMGMYTVEDPSKLELAGNLESINKSWFTLAFTPCVQSEASPGCADKATVKSFLDKYQLMIATGFNFIDINKKLTFA